MRKLALDVEALQVESFDPAPAAMQVVSGTVQARESGPNPSNDPDVTCPNHTCLPPPTLDSTPACCVGP